MSHGTHKHTHKIINVHLLFLNDWKQTGRGRRVEASDLGRDSTLKKKKKIAPRVLQSKRVANAVLNLNVTLSDTSSPSTRLHWPHGPHQETGREIKVA